MKHLSLWSIQIASILIKTVLIVSMTFPISENGTAQGNTIPEIPTELKISQETPQPPEDSTACHTLAIASNGIGNIPSVNLIRSWPVCMVVLAKELAFTE
jgi:hypothetical protein